MWAVFILATTFWTGAQLLQLVPVKWYKLEFWGVAYLVGLLVTTWLLFCCSLVFGYTWGVPLALGIAACSSLFLQWRYPQRQHWASLPSLFYRWLTAAYVVGWGGLLSAVFRHHAFIIKPDGWYSGGNTWADWALHSTLITSFAYQARPVLQFPIYPEAPLTYPFLFDFYTALLLRGGFSIQLSLFLTSVLTFGALLLVLYFLLWRITQSGLVAALTSVVWIGNSSLGSWYFWQDWSRSGLSLTSFLSYAPSSYVHMEERGLYWAQVFVDLLLPQRGILVGTGVFFLFCLLLHFSLYPNTIYPSSNDENKTNAKNAKIDIPPVFIRYSFAFLLGLLPLFHIHSFLVLVGVLGWYLFWQLHAKRWNVPQLMREWSSPALVAAGLAVPQLWWQFGHTFGQGFMSWQWGWLAQQEGLISFWWRNLGLQLPLAVLGIWYVFRSPTVSRTVRLLVAPLVILFLICNLISFQPSIWDNTKFMVYGHWAMVVSILFLFHHWLSSTAQAASKESALLQRWLNRGTAVGVGILLLILTSGGILATIRELNLDWPSVNNQDLTVVSFIKNNTPAASVFLTASTHNHPVPMLTGRPIVMGYPGWLWTYGINYAQTEQDVAAIYSGSPKALELLTSKNVKYIFVSNRERAQFSVNDGFLRQFALIYNDQENQIYQVTSH